MIASRPRPVCAVLALLVLAASFVDTNASGPVVSVKQGKMEGVYEEVLGSKVAAFRGVPFAQPPVGREGRWKPPRPAIPWTGILNATANGPICVQPDNSGQEDCLYLNVFVPQSFFSRDAAAPVKSGRAGTSRTSSGLPVFFWIYGGSLMNGFAQSYGPVENLVSLSGGSVIVVALNYRLNAFGFLALPNLSADDPRGTSGNYGFLDQQAGLRWVQDNIAAFGGDPSRVTVYGQSSGGTSILSLLASPGSKGLFHAAISLSGSPNITLDLHDAENQNVNGWLQGTRCATALPYDSLDCIYDLNPAEITAAIPPSWLPDSMFPLRPGPSHLPGLPVIDGVTLTMPVKDALEQGLVDVTLVLGTMRDEDDISPNNTILAWDHSQWLDFMSSRFKQWGSDAPSKLSDLYANVALANPGQAFYDLDADIGVTCGNAALASAAARGFSRPVYLVYNGQPPSHPFPAGLESLTYPFHIWDYLAATSTWNLVPLQYFAPESSDLAYGKALRDQWLSIGKTGDVTSDSGWLPVSRTANHGPTVVFENGTVSTIADWKVRTCAVFQEVGIHQGEWWVN